MIHQRWTIITVLYFNVYFPIMIFYFAFAADGRRQIFAWSLPGQRFEVVPFQEALLALWRSVQAQRGRSVERWRFPTRFDPRHTGIIYGAITVHWHNRFYRSGPWWGKNASHYCQFVSWTARPVYMRQNDTVQPCTSLHHSLVFQVPGTRHLLIFISHLLLQAQWRLRPWNHGGDARENRCRRWWWWWWRPADCAEWKKKRSGCSGGGQGECIVQNFRPFYFDRRCQSFGNWYLPSTGLG